MGDGYRTVKETKQTKLYGCYKDDEAHSPFDKVFGSVPSAESCMWNARMYGHQYFALGDGTQCFGSNNLAKAMSLGAAVDCNLRMRPPDDGQIPAGGRSSFHLYEVPAGLNFVK